MIRAIIIEDEEDSQTALCKMLHQYFKYVEVMAVCRNNEDGKSAIEELKPDLVFSDIELENNPVFNMFQQLCSIDFEIIFTTAYERYAIQAIKFCAIDYLLKPFSPEDLSSAIKRYEQRKDKQQSQQQFDALFHNLRHLQKEAKKIALPSSNGLIIVPLKEIIRCEAGINYTNFFLTTKQKIIVAKTLKEYEELLSDYDFVRVHNSHLINLLHAKNYIRGEGGLVAMTDGTEVEVSRRKKEELLKRLAAL